MKRIDTFSHTDVAFIQYLQKVLGDHGIECFIKNENIAIAGFSERTPLALSPELWVLDDVKFDEAVKIIEELREGED